MATLQPHSNGVLYSNTVIDTLAVTFGTARKGLRGLWPVALPNVTAHPSTVSVPTGTIITFAL